MSNRFAGGPTERLNGTYSSGSSSKRSFIIFGFIILIFVISTIVLGALYGREKSKNQPQPTHDSTCLTPYCIKAANYIIDSIDETVEPCEDFYQFSCGTWLKNHRIPDDSNAQNTFRILDARLDENIVDLLSTNSDQRLDSLQCVMNARKLYRSCIDEDSIDTEGIEPILSLINEFGGWPIIQGSSWNESTFDLQNLLLKLRQYSYNIIFRINSDTDEKNSSASNIIVGQGILGLPQRSYFEKDNITAAYRQFMSKLAELLSNDTSMIKEDVDNTFQFEKNISKYYYTFDEQSARSNETIRTTVSELYRTLNTSFNFTEYLRLAYSYSGVTLNDADVVAVNEIDFLTNASSVIDEVSPQNMPRYIRTVKEQFNRVFQGTNAEKPRTVQCGIFVNNNMGFVVSKLYIKKYFDEVARNQSLDLIENIRNSFVGLLEQATWMEKESKDKAVDKAKAIDKQIGYPDYLGSDNNTKLESDYAEYIFNSTYIRNVLKLLMLKSTENLQSLRKPVDRKAWGSLPPTVVNAFYDPSENQISFPAGILQTPFFDKDAPKYLNFGGIGVVIGHEITHGFDDTGRQFDKDGNRIPWWTQNTINDFNDRKQCIIDQYSNYTVPSIHMNSNGNQTQGEDIADNGGVKAAFYAYQNWAKSNTNVDRRLPGLSKYSPEQLFFINFAHVWCIKMTDAFALNRLLTDVHSLGPFRVAGPTSNFAEFDQAFGCKPGQGNSRVKKCTVW